MPNNLEPLHYSLDIRIALDLSILNERSKLRGTFKGEWPYNFRNIFF